MTFSDQTLMAYVDGELDDATRAAVDLAIAREPAVARAVERQQALRTTLQGAFAAVLAESVPQKLVDAARSAPARAPEVTDLASARAQRSQRSQRSADEASSRQMSWMQWGALAASIVVGLLVGRFYQTSADRGPFVLHAGQLLAQGALAQALSTQLASDRPQDAVAHLGVSFRTRSGEYCRIFTFADAGSDHATLAGLACQEQHRWRIELLAPGATPANDNYRMAASDMPKAVLQALEDRISGEPLDAAGEAAARGRGWQP